MAKKKRLSARQQRFVNRYARGDTTATQALIESGYNPKDRAVAAVQASTILSKPYIQNALQVAMEKANPDLATKAAEKINELLSHESPNVQIKILDMLIKVYGWNAPQKKANLNVNIKEKFKLPEE